MKPLYPWDRWLSHPIIVLVRGAHYLVPQSTIIQQLRNAASHRGYRVSVADQGDRVHVTVARKETSV